MARHQTSSYKPLRGRSRGPSQRQLRAGELLRHALVEILQREDLRDPDLRNVSMTVSEVSVSPDLRQADIFCLPLGFDPNSNETDQVIAALNRCAPYVRGLLGKRIELKFTPALTFRKDPSFDEASRVDAILSRPDVKRDLGHPEDEDDG